MRRRTLAMLCAAVLYAAVPLTTLTGCGAADIEPVQDEPVRDTGTMDSPPVFAAGYDPGNIASGGYTAMHEVHGEDEFGKPRTERTIFAALSDGIYKGYMPGSFERICGDKASCLNVYEGRVYYICTFEKDGKIYEEIASVDLDGKNRRVHVQALEAAEKLVIADEDGRNVACTVRDGFTDLHLAQGNLYYIASNGNPGECEFTTASGEKMHVMWESGHSVRTINVNTGPYGNSVVLVEEIGNGACRLNLGTSNGDYVLHYTSVIDGGAQDAVHTEIWRKRTRDASQKGERIANVNEEIVVFSAEAHYTGRDGEGNDALRIVSLYQENGLMQYKDLPGIALPLQKEGNLYWLSGERAEDGWKNVTVMRSWEDGSEIKHKPVCTLGEVKKGSEFAKFALSEHNSSLYLRTEDALWRVGLSVNTDLVKLIDTSIK